MQDTDHCRHRGLFTRSEETQVSQEVGFACETTRGLELDRWWVLRES